MANERKEKNRKLVFSRFICCLSRIRTSCLKSLLPDHPRPKQCRTCLLSFVNKRQFFLKHSEQLKVSPERRFANLGLHAAVL